MRRKSVTRARGATDKQGALQGSAGLLGITVGEKGAFLGEPVDVRCPVAHQTPMIGADVVLPDVITPNHEDVGLLGPIALALRVRARVRESERGCCQKGKSLQSDGS